MRVEYDKSMRQFKIYRSDYDSNCTIASYSGVVQSYRVVSDNEFEVIGQFSDRSLFNADGRLVS